MSRAVHDELMLTDTVYVAGVAETAARREEDPQAQQHWGLSKISKPEQNDRTASKRHKLRKAGIQLMGKFASTCLFLFASIGTINPSFSKSCPANIGDYGYNDGRGGSFGETLMALNMNAPHCVCKLNQQWIKEWYYSMGDVESKLNYSAWVKRCKG